MLGVRVLPRSSLKKRKSFLSYSLCSAMIFASTSSVDWCEDERVSHG